MPLSCRFQYFPVKAISVSALRVMSKTPRPSCCRHWSGVLMTFVVATFFRRWPESENKTTVTSLGSGTASGAAFETAGRFHCHKTRQLRSHGRRRHDLGGGPRTVQDVRFAGRKFRVPESRTDQVPSRPAASEAQRRSGRSRNRQDATVGRFQNHSQSSAHGNRHPLETRLAASPPHHFPLQTRRGKPSLCGLNFERLNVQRPDPVYTSGSEEHTS